MSADHPVDLVAARLAAGLGRRRLMQVAAALGAGGVATMASGCGAASVAADGPASSSSSGPGTVLQPGQGPIPGEHYLPSRTDEVLWGFAPSAHADPVLTMASGSTVTVDTVSHEGILEDQGRDPRAWFGSHGVAEGDVLTDAVDIAAHYSRTERDFDKDGPHVITGPIHVEGAAPGDVLKVETLDVVPRVPYGVVSSRHGKGALALTAEGEAPAGITREEVMPPVDTDGRATGDPTAYGNVSVLTEVVDGARGRFRGTGLSFPLNPFMGTMGVASSRHTGLKDPAAHSVPPTVHGGNLDVASIGDSGTLYLPVSVEGALFYVGDPHFAQGHGEVALTAVEGSLRATFRLTVCKPGQEGTPSVAYRYPFAETADHWVPIGLSDPHGRAHGTPSGDLDRAMRRAVVNALDFLQHDLGVERHLAYAYLSATADFVLSQVVDQTVGVHGLIRKADFS